MPVDNNKPSKIQQAFQKEKDKQQESEKTKKEPVEQQYNIEELRSTADDISTNPSSVVDAIHKAGPEFKSRTDSSRYDLSDVPTTIADSNPQMMGRSDLEDYAEEGVDLRITSDYNWNTERAKNQGLGEQAFDAVAGGVARGFLTTAENIGYAADIQEWTGMDDEINQAYSNWLSEWAKDAKESDTMDWANIYTMNPDKTMDLSDPAWYAQQIQGIVDSAVGFGLSAAAVGGLVGRGAMLVSNLARSSGQFAQAVARFGTAAATNYMESKLMSYEVYDNAYKQGLRQGLSAERSSQIAAEKANRFIWYNKPNIATDWLQLKYLYKMPVSEAGKKSLRRSLALGAYESLSEGFEEISAGALSRQAQTEAYREIEKEGYKDYTRSLEEEEALHKSAMDRALEYAGSEEGIVEFSAGMFGAHLQKGATALASKTINNHRLFRINQEIKKEEAKPTKEEWKEKYGTGGVKKDQKESEIRDEDKLSYLHKQKNAILDATSEKHREETLLKTNQEFMKNRLIGVDKNAKEALRAIMAGDGDAFEEAYEESLAKLAVLNFDSGRADLLRSTLKEMKNDSTLAQKEGFDEDYAERIERDLEKIEQFQNRYEELHRKYPKSKGFNTGEIFLTEQKKNHVDKIVQYANANVETTKTELNNQLNEIIENEGDSHEISELIGITKQLDELNKLQEKIEKTEDPVIKQSLIEKRNAETDYLNSRRKELLSSIDNKDIDLSKIESQLTGVSDLVENVTRATNARYASRVYGDMYNVMTDAEKVKQQVQEVEEQHKEASNRQKKNADLEEYNRNKKTPQQSLNVDDTLNSILDRYIELGRDQAIETLTEEEMQVLQDNAPRFKQLKDERLGDNQQERKDKTESTEEELYDLEDTTEPTEEVGPTQEEYQLIQHPTNKNQYRVYSDGRIVNDKSGKLINSTSPVGKKVLEQVDQDNLGEPVEETEETLENKVSELKSIPLNKKVGKITNKDKLEVLQEDFSPFAEVNKIENFINSLEIISANQIEVSHHYKVRNPKNNEIFHFRLRELQDLEIISESTFNEELRNPDSEELSKEKAEEILRGYSEIANEDVKDNIERKAGEKKFKEAYQDVLDKVNNEFPVNSVWGNVTVIEPARIFGEEINIIVAPTGIPSYKMSVDISDLKEISTQEYRYNEQEDLMFIFDDTTFNKGRIISLDPDNLVEMTLDNDTFRVKSAPVVDTEDSINNIKERIKRIVEGFKNDKTQQIEEEGESPFIEDDTEGEEEEWDEDTDKDVSDGVYSNDEYTEGNETQASSLQEQYEQDQREKEGQYFLEKGAAKVINPQNALAYLSRRYFPVEEGVKDAEDALNPDLNKDLLDPDKIKEGTSVTLRVVPKDYSFTKSNGETVTYADIIEREINSEKENELVPIEVLVDGERIGFLHTTDYMKGYKDWASKSTDDFKKAKEELMAIRNYIVENGEYKTKISYKGNGIVPKVADRKFRRTASLIKGDNFDVGYTFNNQLLSAKNEPYNKPLVNEGFFSGEFAVPSGVIYMIPKVKGDQGEAIMLHRMKIGNTAEEGNTIADSVINAIDLHMRYDEDIDLATEVDEVFGYDLSLNKRGSNDGLLGLLKNYVAVKNTGQNHLKDIKSNYKTDTHLFTVENNAIEFALGSGYHGAMIFKPGSNKPEKFTFNGRVVEPRFWFGKLKEHLKNSYLNVNINNFGRDNISYPLFRKDEGGNIVYDTAEFNSIQDYVKNTTMTQNLSFNIGTEDKPNHVYKIQQVYRMDFGEILGTNLPKRVSAVSEDLGEFQHAFNQEDLSMEEEHTSRRRQRKGKLQLKCKNKKRS